MSYWDTSALVKLYLKEADSAQFDALALAMPMGTGALTLHEARTVFRRREAEGAIPAGEGRVLFELLCSDSTGGGVAVQAETDAVRREFGEVLERCFSQSPPVFIRTNDALQLASAIVAAEAEFVTADARQKAAAELLGFKVLP